MQADYDRFPEVARSFAQETGQELSAALRERVESCWRHADRIICASSFYPAHVVASRSGPGQMRRGTLRHRSSSPTDCTRRRTDPNSGVSGAICRLGRAAERVCTTCCGAWEQATLPAESRLTLVCRVLDPGLRERVERLKNVRWLPGVPPRRTRRALSSGAVCSPCLR